MRLIHVVATAENGVIGKDGKIPWHSREDLRFFKELTMGHAMLMGRKTYESIGRPLPGRKTIVLTRDRSYRPDGEVIVAHTVADALAAAEGVQDRFPDPLFVLGGGEVYSETLARTDEIFLTLVKGEYEGNARYPGVPDGFELVKKEDVAATPALTFCHYIRKGGR